MRKVMGIAVTVALCTASGWAQSPGFEFDWSKLAPKAVEHVEVSLDQNMLTLAGKFLQGGKGGDEAKIKGLLQNLKGVYVRSFRFANEGEYSLSDVDKFRSQFNGGGWSKIVDVRSTRPGGENTGVYLKSNGDEIQGIVVIAAERKELTVVNILGNIRPDQIQQLGGKFGIPDLDLPDAATKQLKKREQKDEDED
ncbi:MAG TPA: DUF4252 domain-containing protein [Hyphomonadaceae bacterium]|nr:DUF4252 domain-containing protein [Hyphomonadaceae bacterium]